MRFDELLDTVTDLLRTQERVSYAGLRKRFDLQDDDLSALHDELVEARRLARDENGKVLVWAGPPARPTPMAVEPSAAERRQLTVMFCDIVDSTGLAARLDPEDLRELLRAYQGVVAGAVERFHGHVAQYLGDGVLVYFGWPQAHEDDAQRAVRAGLGILDGVGRLNRENGAGPRPDIAVRVGIHTGEVVVGEIGAGERLERLALGETPNVAARLEGLADPGNVIVGEQTLRLLEGRFFTEDLGLQRLRGVAVAMRVYRVTGDTGIRSRFDIGAGTKLLSLAGRRAELRLLVGLWNKAKSGTGKLALVSGEAGIGKSRLVQALKEHVSAQGHPWGSIRCSPYFRSTPLHPVVELWRQALGVDSAGADADATERLQTQLGLYGFDQHDDLSFFAELLELPLPPERGQAVEDSPARRRERAIEGVMRIVLGMAARQPYLLVVEDLQWIDPTTAEVLRRVGNVVGDHPLLAVYTARPEIPPGCDSPDILSLRLDGLGQPDVEEMILEITEGHPLPSDIESRIRERTDGVPAFVEELTRMVLESGLLTPSDGRYVLSGELPELGVPVTLRDSLMARLDRLGPAKHVAQIAAVIGRWFDADLLRTVAAMDEVELQAALARLAERGLLVASGDSGPAAYRFRHALIQEVAYGSLLRSTRKELHGRIARALETHFAAFGRSHPELVAHHHTEAGDALSAIAHWRRAGGLALEQSASIEASAHLERGLGLLDQVSDPARRETEELMLRSMLGSALVASKGWASPEAEACYRRALTLCERIGDACSLTPALVGLYAFHAVRCDLELAQRLAGEISALADRGHPDATQAAHTAYGNVYLLKGDLARAREQLLLGSELGDESVDTRATHLYGLHSEVACRGWLPMTRWLLGQAAQSRHDLDTAVAVARRHAHPFSLGFALTWTARVHHLRGEQDIAARMLQESAAIALQHGLPLVSASSSVLQGLVTAARGRPDAGLDELRSGLDAWAATGARVTVHFQGAHADVLQRNGRHEEALVVLANAQRAAAQTGEHWWSPELLRLQGEILARDDPARAVECLEQAVEIAQTQGAAAWRLRCCTALAGLLAANGQRAEAISRLRSALDTIEGGAGTADVERARARLMKL